MILDAVSQEQLNNSNITATGTGSVATLKNSLGGKQLVYLQANGYNVQDGTPTPESPVDIQCLGESGTIDIKTCGKNLCDCYNSKWSSNGSTTFTKENGIITVNRFANLYSGIYSHSLFANLGHLINKQMVFSLVAKTDTSGMSIKISTNGKSVSKELNTSYQKISLPFTYNGSKELTIYGNAVAGNVYITDMQLELGEVATDYVEHKETVASIPISKPLYEGDYIEVYADGTGQIVRKSAKWLPPSTLNWKVGGGGGNSRIATIPESILSNMQTAVSGGVPDAVSNIAIASKWNDTAKMTNGFCLSYDGYVAFSYEGTVDEFKTMLTQNSTYIIYKLKTPVTEPLTAEQVEAFKSLYTFDKLTHVTADGTAKLVVTGYHNNGDTIALFHKAGTEFIGEFKGDSTEVACDLNKYSCLIMMIEYGTVLEDTDVIPVELLQSNYFYIQTWYRVNADTLAISSSHSFRIDTIDNGISGVTESSNGAPFNGLLYGVLK